jgi:phosphoribosylaminoimidazole-succinocarboxamide synthase
MRYAVFPEVVFSTNIEGANLINRGKVRDIYEAGDYLLIVASDRISAFDVVMKEGIPGKGIILSQISKFWFNHVKGIVNAHFVTDIVSEFPDPFNKYEKILKGRAMLVKKAKPLPVECIVRGYLAGSGWKEYRRQGTLHKQKLPSELLESSQLPTPLFTPSTKAEEGHDENITFNEMTKLVDKPIAEKVRNYSINIYKRGVEIASERGIIIADTKFEFGEMGSEIILIDEVLTPDSSRFWPKENYSAGRSQPSLDKQYVRDYLETLDWGKTPPPPSLPENVIKNTSLKYQEILKILTRKTLEDFI